MMDGDAQGVTQMRVGLTKEEYQVVKRYQAEYF